MKRGWIVIAAVALGIALILAPTVTRIVLLVLAGTSVIGGAICAAAALWNGRDDSWAYRANQLLTVGFVTAASAAASAVTVM